MPQRTIEPGTQEYVNQVCAVAEKVKTDPGEWRIAGYAKDDDGEPLVVEGVLWSDVWDYVYGAMAESSFLKGGALIPVDASGEVLQPLRGYDH
jgi:hypothetical protein